MACNDDWPTNMRFHAEQLCFDQHFFVDFPNKNMKNMPEQCGFYHPNLRIFSLKSLNQEATMEQKMSVFFFRYSTLPKKSTMSIMCLEASSKVPQINLTSRWNTMEIAEVSFTNWRCAHEFYWGGHHKNGGYHLRASNTIKIFVQKVIRHNKTCRR